MASKKVAIIICSYNMPEKTDKLCEKIFDVVKVPYNLIVVDNGSDLIDPSKYTTLSLSDNKQTAGGFLAGYEYADTIGDHYAYWHIITSAELPEDDPRDPLELMLNVMDEDTYAVHPATTFNHSAWEETMTPKGKGYRKVHNTDYIAVLLNKEKFDRIGRLRPELTYAWGSIGECNWKARRNGWKLFILDDYIIHKETDIGYEMGRMNMTAQERRENASKQCDEVLIPLYGENFRWRFWNEYT